MKRDQIENRDTNWFGFIHPQSVVSLQISLWTIKHIEMFDLGPESKNNRISPNVLSLWKHIVHKPNFHSLEE